MRSVVLFVSIFGMAFAGGPAWSQGSLGSSSAHIFLVQDCTDAGWASGDVGVKCFESVADVVDKIWGSGGLFPTASTPLTVDIGPGTFSGVINCPDGEGHTTFRGAGRDRTVISGVSYGSGLVSSAVAATNCDALGFDSLKLFADTAGSFAGGYAVFWLGGGSSSWTDVDMEANQVGWYDHACGGGSTDASAGIHYFWGSTVRGGRIGYFSECGETWFYGGEIDNFASLKGSFSNPMTGVWVSHRAVFHMFGSAVRLMTTGVSSGSGSAVGVRVGPAGNIGVATGYGEFHSHGGVVSVNTSNLSGVAATGLKLDNSSGTGDAKAHTHETGFAVKGGSTSTRLSGTGSFESPHLWEAGTSPPTAGGAIDGHDIYVETDCNSSGCSGGSDPHLMIYKAGCSSSPWFDTVRNACRN